MARRDIVWNGVEWHDECRVVPGHRETKPKHASNTGAVLHRIMAPSWEKASVSPVHSVGQGWGLEWLWPMLSEL